MYLALIYSIPNLLNDVATNSYGYYTSRDEQVRQSNLWGRTFI
jgi:hypothetical protein